MSLKWLNEIAPFLNEKCTGMHNQAEQQTGHLLYKALVAVLPCGMCSFKELLRPFMKRLKEKIKFPSLLLWNRKLEGNVEALYVVSHLDNIS